MEQFVESVAEAHKVYRLLRRYYSAKGIAVANGSATGKHEIPSLYEKMHSSRALKRGVFGIFPFLEPAARFN